MSSELNKASKSKSATTLTAAICGGVVAGMLGMAYVAVPLYKLFCQTTGYGGTTQASASGTAIVDRMIRISFDANVDPKLPWRFEPDQKYVDVKLGEVAQISYHAHNLSNRRITGTATYNVTPYALGLYFSKIQCFCFSEQVLEPGQDVHMPVLFYVDPSMLGDLTSKSITTATLSYTFYEAAKTADAVSVPAR